MTNDKRNVDYAVFSQFSDTISYTFGRMAEVFPYVALRVILSEKMQRYH